MTTTENTNEPAGNLEAATALAAEIDAVLAQASHELAQAGHVTGPDVLTAGVKDGLGLLRAFHHDAGAVPAVLANMDAPELSAVVVGLLPLVRLARTVAHDLDFDDWCAAILQAANDSAAGDVRG